MGSRETGTGRQSRSRGKALVISFDNQTAGSAIKSVFGKIPSAEEFARMVGAPDDARLILDEVQGVLRLKTEHPFFQRKINTFHVKKDGRIEVFNSPMIITPDAPNDFVKQTIQRQIAEAKSTGISSIRANLYTPNSNAYVYTELGFKGEISYETFYKMPKNIQKQMGESLSIQDIIKTEEGQNWWKDNARAGDAEFQLG